MKKQNVSRAKAAIRWEIPGTPKAVLEEIEIRRRHRMRLRKRNESDCRNRLGK
jgi:hypothetical protein